MFITSFAFAQQGRDEALAKSYFEKEEYEKAAALLYPLWEKNNQSVEFYRPLLTSYYKLKV
jgi:hypothetical protein